MSTIRIDALRHSYMRAPASDADFALKRVDQLLNPQAIEQLQQLLEEKMMSSYLLTWLQQEPSSFKCYQMRGQVLRK